MAVESYAHVHHIVSGITGTLRPETTPGAVLRKEDPRLLTGTGAFTADDLLGEIFGRFCIGK